MPTIPLKEILSKHVARRLRTLQKKRNFDPRLGARQTAGMVDPEVHKDFGRFDELLKVVKAFHLDVEVPYDAGAIPLESKPTRVYFAQAVGTSSWKIGCSQNPPKRAQGLQTGNPKVLNVVRSIPGDKTLERQIHRYLKHYQIQGMTREWFSLNRRVVLALVKRLKFQEDREFLLTSSLLKDQQKKRMPR